MKRAPIVTTLLVATFLLLSAAALAGNRPLMRDIDGEPCPTSTWSSSATRSGPSGTVEDLCNDYLGWIIHDVVVTGGN